jgi:hypothetical protein
MGVESRGLVGEMGVGYQTITRKYLIDCLTFA